MSETRTIRIPEVVVNAMDNYLEDNDTTQTNLIVKLLEEHLRMEGYISECEEVLVRSPGRPKVKVLLDEARDKARGSYYFEKKYFASLDLGGIREKLLANDLEVNGAGFAGGCKDCGKERKNYKVHICTEVDGTEYFIPHLLKHLKTGEHELCFRCYDIRYKALESFRGSMLGVD